MNNVYSRQIFSGEFTFTRFLSAEYKKKILEKMGISNPSSKWTLEQKDIENLKEIFLKISRICS